MGHGGVLEGVRVKLRRAEAHTRDLHDILAPLVDSATNSLSRESDGDPSKLLYRMTRVPAIEPGVNAIVGDALYNLRSAFDHLAWRLVELDGGTPCEHTQFPIYNSSLNAKGNLRVITIQPQIRRTDILKALAAAQPYQGWEESLWTTHSLCNIDKHRLLLVMACAVNVYSSWWALPGEVPNPRVHITQKPLDAGDPVARFDFQGHKPPTDFNPSIPIVICLDEGPSRGRIRMQNVTELLHELHRSHAETMNRLFIPLFPNERPIDYPRLL